MMMSSKYIFNKYQSFFKVFYIRLEITLETTLEITLEYLNRDCGFSLIESIFLYFLG